MASEFEKCSAEPNESHGFVWVVGFLFLSIFLFKILRSIWRGLYTCFIADLIGATVDWKKLGKWAVVTGATDGIGKAYAKNLASRGFDIVLISRTQEKLNSVAAEIEEKYSVNTKTVAANATDDVVIYDKIRKEIEDLDIGVLVNNVGMSYAYAEYITKVANAEKFIDDVIKANIVSCTRTTMLVLPLMEKKGKGVILNIASLSALSPVPLLSVYSAAKAFVNFFSKATQEEYKAKGLIIQSVLPGFVSTNMSKMRPSLTTCTPEAFVRWAMKTVGVETQTYGYPVHKLHGYIQEVLNMFLPESVNLVIAHRMMSDIRRRYYKKYGLKDDSKITLDKEK